MPASMPPPPILAVRAGTVLPLAGERPARGMDALCAPLARIRDGVVAARDGMILAVEPYKDFVRRANLPQCELRDLGDVILAPGLVNCHTHLELSHMSGKTLTGQGFGKWVASLVALDRPGPSPDAVNAAMTAAMADMVRHGTAMAGDISSRTPGGVLEAGEKTGLGLRVFLEIFGHGPSGPSGPTDPNESAGSAGSTGLTGSAGSAGRTPLLPFAETALTDIRFSLAGHALYSTSFDLMRRARDWCAANSRPFGMHLAEHADEMECLLTGTGAFCDVLRERVLPETWRAPGKRPVPLADEAGLLAPGTLAVHCVHCDHTDIEILAASGAAVCLCPRSNALIGVGGEAPARAFAEAGALLVLGTDSLASNTDCNVWNEADYFLQKNTLPANALLRMATVNGAAVLGCLREFGVLERGRRFCYRVFPSELNTLLR